MMRGVHAKPIFGPKLLKSSGMCGFSVTLVGKPAAQKPLATFWTEMSCSRLIACWSHSQRRPRLRVEVALDAPIVLTVKSQAFSLKLKLNGPSVSESWLQIPFQFDLASGAGQFAAPLRK